MQIESSIKDLSKEAMIYSGIFFIILAGLAMSNANAAGVTVFKEGDKYVKLGGRIQVQYHMTDPDGGDQDDKMFFRRFRPYIEGSLHENWKGKLQWEMGGAGDENELAVKDVYLQYTGFKTIVISIGNKNFPFSRELLTSSKKQQLVERTFVGDHNYGTPDRNIGIHIAGAAAERQFEYALSVASSAIDPDANKLDFDTPANRNSDFNEGWIVGGRIDYHAFGHLKKEQGDFEGKTLATIGLAGFAWNNDDDNNTWTVDGISTSGSKPDVDSVTGFEISAGLRAAGLSVDVQYNFFNAETIDPGFTGGIFENGDADLDNWAIESGFMIVPSKLEVAAGYQSQDADTYADEWTRFSFGLNYFIKKHDIKIQVTYRMGENLKGKIDDDENELFIQAQYVF